MEQLPGNSHRGRKESSSAEPQKPTRVVTGEVVARKKPIGRRIAAAFFASRADVVGESVVKDVLLPAAQHAAADSVISFVNSLIFGTGFPGNRGPVVRGGVGTYGHNTQQVNYNAIGNKVPGTPAISKTGRAKHDFKEILIPTRVEAEAVLAQMLWRIEEYNAVTVSDFYEICGISWDYTDDKYGWTDIRGAGVLPTRDGRYVLDLPRPEPLD